MHGQHDALDLEVGIEGRLDQVDGLLELGDAFQREKLALHRHQHGIAATMALRVSRLSDGGQSIST